MFRHTDERLEVNRLLRGLASTASNSSGGVPGFRDRLIRLNNEDVINRCTDRARSFASASIIWHGECVDFILSASFDESEQERKGRLDFEVSFNQTQSITSIERLDNLLRFKHFTFVKWQGVNKLIRLLVRRMGRPRLLFIDHYHGFQLHSAGY